MQVAIIYDSGLKGLRMMQILAKKHGKPTYHNEETGEIVFKTDDVGAILNDIVPHVGELVCLFFVGGNDEDLGQFLDL